MTSAYANARVGTWRVREGQGPQKDRPDDSRGKPRFQLGRLFATRGAIELLAGIRDRGKPHSVRIAAQTHDPMMLILPYLARHAAGDWGDVDAEDAVANDAALVAGERLLSAYSLPSGERLWIITEADRHATTVLLPDEY